MLQLDSLSGRSRDKVLTCVLALLLTQKFEHMDASRKLVLVFRGSVLVLLITYVLALYSELAPVQLSSEANQHQQTVSDTMAGFSIKFALQRICWLLGNGLGISGIVLLFLRSGCGLPPLLLSAPVLALAALLGASPRAYPAVESTPNLLLWCISSAIWGGVVVYAFVRRDLLFVRRGAEIPLGKGSA